MSEQSSAEQETKKTDAESVTDPKGSSDKKGAKKKPSKKDKKATSGAGDQIATLGKRFEILCAERLPEYDLGEAKAYRARPRKGDGNYYALVCERHLVVRHRAAAVYGNLINPSLVKLVDENAVFWPPAKQERYVFIYANNLGGRLLKLESPKALGMKQERVLEAIVAPMVGVLQDFRDKDFVHGSINPSNMYDGGRGESFERVILGDCLSVPASYAQPALYETAERALADPIGRGPGTLADDIYAFGVSLAVILRSHDPLEGKTDQEIIQAKIENGSYATVTGKDRFTGSILELLRGLLVDDPGQRWRVEDIMAWLDGQRLSPKQALRETKASRPIMFDNHKYYFASFLAMDIHKNPQETIRICEGKDLEQWIERSLEDAEKLERFETVMTSMQGKARGPRYEAELLSKLSIVLDPSAPIRYRGLSVNGDGVGLAVVNALMQKTDVSDIADLLAVGIGLDWAAGQASSNLDVGALISRFDQCRTYMKQSKAGYGVERCAYLMSPDAYCLSEKLIDYYVRSSEDMIYAFEDMCAKGKAHGLFLDRHSVAFLAVRDPKSVDSYMVELQSSDHYKKVLGNLKCLATIQKRHSLGTMTQIAQNFLTKLPVVYERYHDRMVRDKLKAGIEKFAAQGDLVKMASVLDNVEVSNKDLNGFKKAMVEYAELQKEHDTLEARLQDKDSFGRGTGKEIAALISCALAAIIIRAVVSLFMTDTSIF